MVIGIVYAMAASDGRPGMAEGVKSTDSQASVSATVTLPASNDVSASLVESVDTIGQMFPSHHCWIWHFLQSCL